MKRKSRDVVDDVPELSLDEEESLDDEDLSESLEDGDGGGGGDGDGGGDDDDDDSGSGSGSDSEEDDDDDDDVDALDVPSTANGGGAGASASQQVPRGISGQGKVVFCLEKASLETAKVGKGYQLLNCDDHATFLKRHKRDPSDYRPDIVHQTLLQILDSPLNKAGRVSAVYVHTQKNVLISVNPSVRIPRTFKRFCGLMVQLLQKLSIRASNGPDKLLKVIKHPITKHLPVNVPRVGFSFSSETIVRFQDYVTSQKKRLDSVGIVYVLGAMAHGKIDMSYTDTHVSVSEYPLSAAYCASRITNAMENIWNIV